MLTLVKSQFKLNRIFGPIITHKIYINQQLWMNIITMKHIIKIKTLDLVPQKKMLIMLIIEDLLAKGNLKKEKQLVYVLLEINKQIYKSIWMKKILKLDQVQKQ